MPAEEPWSEEELRASVEAYSEMYLAAQENRKVNKAQIYRDLGERFDRNHKAFERRMQNISDVVSQMGGNHVPGLRPLSHIGPVNRSILERLVRQVGFLDGEE